MGHLVKAKRNLTDELGSFTDDKTEVQVFHSP